MELNNHKELKFFSYETLPGLLNGIESLHDESQASNVYTTTTISVPKRSISKNVDRGKDTLKVEPFPSNQRHSVRPPSANWRVAANVFKATNAFRTIKDEKNNQQQRKMRGSDAYIPVLPLSLSCALCLCNCIIPGLGTMISSFTFFCTATTHDEPDHTRVKDKMINLVFINLGVGIAQLFTTTFLLVGWFWSLSRGVTMIYLSLEAIEAKNKELAQANQKVV